jgi:hypothetical protein
MSTTSWSFTTLPVAAKYQMSSVQDFLMLETAFTVVQFAIVSPLIALAYRGTLVPHPVPGVSIGSSICSTPTLRASMATTRP